jgi:hypothetical protein
MGICGIVRSTYRLVLVTALLGLLLGGTRQLQATPIINNIGLTSPAATITFDNPVYATGTPITDQYAGQGVTFVPGLFYNVQPVFFPTPSLANFDLLGDVNNPVTINFLQDQTGAAFAMQTNAGDSTFTALLNGTVVESFSAPTELSILPDLTNASNFYGFTGITFNQIEILSGTTFFQIDNLQLSASSVPEPSSFVMGSLGGLLCVAYGWSRRRATPWRP